MGKEAWNQKKTFKSNLNSLFVSGGVKIDKRTRGAEFRKVKVQPRRHSCKTQKGTEGNKEKTTKEKEKVRVRFNK